ncbi:MAG: hypothetical protein VW362_01605 [Candidatus Nanopelagicales bacterium]
MTPTEYLTDVIPPAMALLPSAMDTQEARAMLIAIALQESRLLYRKQIGGPARGFHQFETGGVRAVLRHTATAAHAQDVLTTLGYATPDPLVFADVSGLHTAFTTDDLLDCAFARLLLYADARPMPPANAYDLSWDIYLFGWRPGKPHRQTWNAFYDQAWAVV